MKIPQPYRVKQAYALYRKGAIVYPTGMHKDELLMLGRIEKVGIEAPASITEAPDAPVLDDISGDEDDCLIESAVEPEPIRAEMPRGQKWKRRHG